MPNEEENKPQETGPQGNQAPQEQKASAKQAQATAAPAQEKPAKASKSTEPGAVAKAWTDITGHPGWWKRVLLLMFMGIVPFLNFFVGGYLLKWATKTSNTESKGLPRYTFDGQSFVWGFLFAVLQLICSVIIFVIALILGLVPIVGFILVWFFGIFASGFIYMAGIRMVQKNSFKDAFDLSQIFEVLKRDPWHLFLAVFLPALAVGVVTAVIVFLFASGFILANIHNAINIFNGAANLAYNSSSSSLSGLSALGTNSLSHSYGYVQPDMISSIISLLAGLGGTLLVLFIIVGILATFGEIWIVRAVAHWLRQTAPEWFEGRDVPFTEKTEKAKE